MFSLDNLWLERETLKDHGIFPSGEQVYLKDNQRPFGPQRRIKISLDKIPQGDRQEINHKLNWLLQTILMALKAKKVNLQDHHR